MAIQFAPIIKILSKSGSIAGTVDSLFKQYKKIKQDSNAIDELQKLSEVQEKINEKLEAQIELFNSMIMEIQKSVKVLSYLCFGAIVLAATAIIVSIAK